MSTTQRKVAAGGLLLFALSCLLLPVRPQTPGVERLWAWDANLPTYDIDWAMVGVRTAVLAAATLAAVLLTGRR